jgi:hypothetical protein
MLDCENQLGIVQSGRGEYEKAQVHLEEALSLYESRKSFFTNEDEDSRMLFLDMLAFRCLSGTHAVFLTSSFPASLERLESLHTHSLFYLAQVYGHMKKIKLVRNPKVVDTSVDELVVGSEILLSNSLSTIQHAEIRSSGSSRTITII